MKNLRSILLMIIVVSAIPTIAQQVSVLPQFFAANPIIKRDPTFENLQKYLTKAKENTQLGLTENFSKRLEGVRKYVESSGINLSLVEIDEINKTFKIKVEYSLFGTAEEIVYGKKEFLKSKDEIIAKLVKAFVEQVPKKYPSLSNNQSASNTFNAIILYLLSASLNPEQIEIANYVSTDNDRYVTIVSEGLSDFLEKLLDLEENFNEEDINKAIISINALIGNFKSKVSEGLYQLQEIIEKTKGDLSQTLVSANTGIGINQDEGSFGGGLILTFRSKILKSKRNFQGAVFISGVGQTGVPDTTHVIQPFLVGTQLDYQISDHTQASLLSSYRYNEKKIGNTNWLFEIGGGFLTKTSNDIIWGVSAFYQFIDNEVTSNDGTKTFEINSLFTCGVSVRAAANTSPTILLGASHQNGWAPVMQISYPINFGKQ